MNTSFLSYVKSELAKRRPTDFDVISKETGIAEGTIRKIHYGEVADPRITTVQALHDYFREQQQKAA